MISFKLPGPAKPHEDWIRHLSQSLRSYLPGSVVARSAIIAFVFIAAQPAPCSSANSVGVQVRLKTRLTSYSSKSGDQFECAVLSPFVVNDKVVIPQGSTVHGHVARVLPRSVLACGMERAKMELVFDDFVTLDGRAFPLGAKLSTSIDNAREEVTAEGTIRGVLAARQPNALLFGVWHMPSISLFSRSPLDSPESATKSGRPHPPGPLAPEVCWRYALSCSDSLSRRFITNREPICCLTLT